MHAARRPRPHQGATAASATHGPARKADRLDLLARMINLRTDGVALALSKPSHAAIERQHWKDLHRQTDTLGRQWAVADPIDAHRLMPSLLTGLDEMTDRFLVAYADATPVEVILEALPLSAEHDERK